MRTSFMTIVAVAATVGLTGIAPAGHDDNPSPKVASYSYDLNPVQADTVANSQAGGSTRVKALPNGKLQVTVEASGLAPNLPHAMHLHGVVEGTDEACPGPAQDADDNGFVTVVEGIPSYGGILTSLTTTGDTSPASALALTRFATADADGNLYYKRNIRVSDDAYAEAGTVQVVVHGIDINGNGAYDFEAGPSSLGDAFPLEGTIPVLCGGIAN